jgi:hypothetical protein
VTSRIGKALVAGELEYDADGAQSAEKPSTKAKRLVWES